MTIELVAICNPDLGIRQFKRAVLYTAPTIYSNIISFSFMYAYVFFGAWSSFSISFTMLAILSCTASMLAAVMTAFLLPLAPACAKPLNAPITAMFSPAIISAPPFRSPISTTLPSYSIFCP